MAQDPIGTPRRSTSLANSATSATGLGRSASNSIWTTDSAPSRVTSGATANTASLAVGGSQSEHVQGLWDRFTFLKNTDNIKNNLLEDVLTRYSHLTQVFEEYKRENLLRLGEEGGKKAARQLKSAAAKYLASLDGMPKDLRIAARLYTNVSGLAQTCVRARLVSSVTIVEDFLRGFTYGDDLFDVIDVGYGKDRADGKVIANFKHEVHNYQCRHILFGCSHDNGFARHLERYTHDDATVAKVTLLEGVPFEKELRTLPYQQQKFPGLFRDSKIVVNSVDLVTADFSRLRHDSKHNLNVFNPNSAVFTPPSQTPAPTTPAFSPKTLASDALGPLRNDLTRTNSMSSVALSEAAPSVSTPNGGGWANIAKGSAHLPYKDLTKKVAEPLPTGPAVLLNKDDQRIDVEMEYDHEKVFSLKKIKLCNQHYIGRGCCHYQAGNRNCPHRHDLNLSAEDRKWLRVVARETVCKKGTACLELDCIYGHHCPYPKQTEGPQKGIACINGVNCRFAKEMHGMDMTVAKTLREQDLELMDA
ncbi:uncharacterized protein MYCFIDRAFT_82071 [Pseudocercospora fijiensis CIRAD86]|uniref:C3H1-type domain-containing protein n=1 Tax=Pseudocercospora fijiensis (strain CIRAD86) TaxID=383855 RepID=M3B9X6_PSEFD|nr:uncharacterized protein MYCFIDRAFT_82071 [Pseudocercospora fijiensis CIRAD86]EME86132.1 hypothetical protein MYCFIDRAFT_82071 [Pseudocercospora fijiensis CIRAD86]